MILRADALTRNRLISRASGRALNPHPSGHGRSVERCLHHMRTSLSRCRLSAHAVTQSPAVASDLPTARPPPACTSRTSTASRLAQPAIGTADTVSLRQSTSTRHLSASSIEAARPWHRLAPSTVAHGHRLANTPRHLLTSAPASCNPRQRRIRSTQDSRYGWMRNGGHVIGCALSEKLIEMSDSTMLRTRRQHRDHAQNGLRFRSKRAGGSYFRLFRRRCPTTQTR
jgi:hypothetical protein